MKEEELKKEIRNITSVLRDANPRVVTDTLRRKGIKVNANHVFRLLKEMTKSGLYELYYFAGDRCDSCGRLFSKDLNKHLMPPWIFVHNDRSIPNHTFCNECHLAGKREHNH